MDNDIVTYLGIITKFILTRKPPRGNRDVKRADLILQNGGVTQTRRFHSGIVFFRPGSRSIPRKVMAKMNKGTRDNEGPEVVPFAGTYLPDCAAFVHSNQSANKFLLPYPFAPANR